MSNKTKESLKCLRYSDLVALGIIANRMTLKRWIQAGNFPAPIRLGANSLAWRAAEVEEFLEGRERVTYTGGPEKAS